MGWIRTDEREPEKIGSYLTIVRIKEFDGSIEYHMDMGFWTVGKGVDGQKNPFWLNGIDWDEGQPEVKVTHWMPLPEPPENIEVI